MDIWKTFFYFLNMSGEYRYKPYGQNHLQALKNKQTMKLSVLSQL